MKKAKDIKLNINAFVLKTILAILSIVLTLILLVCFNQNSVALRNSFLQKESFGMPSNFMRFNEKEFERIMSSCANNYVTTISFTFNILIFVIYGCMVVNAVVYAVAHLFVKNSQYKLVDYIKQNQVVVVNSNNNFTLFNKVNTKLTI